MAAIPVLSTERLNIMIRKSTSVLDAYLPEVNSRKGQKFVFKNIKPKYG